MTIADALREAAARLADVSDTARLDAELLMAEAHGVSRSDLLLRHTADSAPEAFAALVARRLAHEPVAQILGRKEFYGRAFRVGRDVLTPRADSETVIAAALAAVPAPARILDLGTGSGALLLTLLAERPSATGIGIDASPGAHAVAEANAVALGLGGRAQLLVRDWNEAGWADDLGRFDLVVANPPYVADSAELARSVRDYEPAAALFAGPEGLDDYRVLIPQLPALLTDDGAAVLEIGADQGRPCRANRCPGWIFQRIAARPCKSAARPHFAIKTWQGPDERVIPLPGPADGPCFPRQRPRSNICKSCRRRSLAVRQMEQPRARWAVWRGVSVTASDASLHPPVKIEDEIP